MEIVSPFKAELLQTMVCTGCVEGGCGDVSAQQNKVLLTNKEQLIGSSPREPPGGAKKYLYRHKYKYKYK